MFSQKFYDKRAFDDDNGLGIALGFDGLEKKDGKIRLSPKYNKNIVGYLTVETSGFDNPDLHASLLVAGNYGANGFYLRKDNYLEKLPMFAASRYITYNREWTERSRIMKSADGAKKFNKDVANGTLNQFLLKCLLFTCVEMQNHMRSFMGSDGRLYRNELCLDTTNGETIAVKDLKNLNANTTEKQILNQWLQILECAKNCSEYNSSLTYGVYQIYAELDKYTIDEITGKKVYTYIELHTALQGLKSLVKEYYNKEIVPVLFEYEFLK